MTCRFFCLRQNRLAEAAARPLPPLSDDERRSLRAIDATETSIDDIAARERIAKRGGFIYTFTAGTETSGQTIARKIFR